MHKSGYADKAAREDIRRRRRAQSEPVYLGGVKVTSISVSPDEAHWLYEFNIGTTALYTEGSTEPVKTWGPKIDDAVMHQAVLRSDGIIKEKPMTQDEINMLSNEGYSVD